jgi:hypothetical protein
MKERDSFWVEFQVEAILFPQGEGEAVRDLWKDRQFRMIAAAEEGIRHLSRRFPPM